MLASPAFLIVALLAMLALTSVSTLRRLSREQRFISRLRALDASTPRRAVRMSELAPEERAIARELMEAGVIREHGHGRTRSCYLDPGALAGRHFKRMRLTLSGALVLVLALVAAFLLLRR